MKRTLSILIVLLLCLFAGCDDVTFPSDDFQTTNNTADVAINSGDEFHEQVPPEAELNLEVMGGKFRFQRIATTPCIVYSNAPIIDMADGTMYNDGHDILTAIFRATDGKDAIFDTYECEFLHYIYMFDNENEAASWHYRFAICDCGAVTITNNNELVCSIEISEEEIQTILNSFSTDTTNNPSECESPDDHDWQIVSRENGCWYSIVYYACSKCDMEQTAESDLALPNHIWEESTVDGKTTFRCTRCNDSHTIMSEIRKFSYAQALEEYKIGDPGVKHEGFNNPAIEIEIESAIDAITRAEYELTIEYDTIAVAYDETSGMWRVVFWTLNLDGNGQSVYVNSDGLTCYIVYGE